jgi:hypothetical protein
MGMIKHFRKLRYCKRGHGEVAFSVLLMLRSETADKVMAQYQRDSNITNNTSHTTI